MGSHRLRVAGLLGAGVLAVGIAGCSPTPTPATAVPTVATKAAAASATPVAPILATATLPPATPTREATPTATAVPVPAATAAATRQVAVPTATAVPAPTATLQAQPTIPPRPTTQAGARARIQTAAGGPVEIQIEVADTPESRSMGLSRRPSLPEGSGMLFIFAVDQQGPFWMKDTLIPLSIAFIGADGRILEIQDMAPMSEELHRPVQGYRYALEVNQGFFSRNGVNPGDRVDIQQ